RDERDRACHAVPLHVSLELGEIPSGLPGCERCQRDDRDETHADRDPCAFRHHVIELCAGWYLNVKGMACVPFGSLTATSSTPNCVTLLEFSCAMSEYTA